jgi:hypothetical protein
MASPKSSSRSGFIELREVEDCLGFDCRYVKSYLSSQRENHPEEFPLVE